MIQRFFQYCFGITIIPTSSKRLDLPCGVLRSSFRGSACFHASSEVYIFRLYYEYILIFRIFAT
jgi:hypothetical protein